MRTAIVAAVIGLLVGALATFAAIERGWIPFQHERAASPVIDNVPTMSQAAAESHRNNQFTSIHTIEDTLALPGDFAQTEALYALAGRSDSADIQNLIFQANGIADSSDRKAALDILFSGLTELDARSALALSRTANFRTERHIEAGVWHSWGKLDLDAALASAATLDSASRRNLAAQALFAAYDYLGNDTTDYIEEALGIGPGSATRAAFLFRLADRDPAAAINYINSMDTPSQQQEAASFLGTRLGRLDVELATRHAALFNDEGPRQAYKIAVMGAAAEVQPEAALDELLAGRPTFEQTMRAQSALQVLAERDIDEALGYLERIGNLQQRAMLAGAVGQVLAREDPERALAWAMENDRSMRNGLYVGVLSSIAMSRPELAIDEAKRLPNPMHRQQAFSMVAMTIAQRNPQQAIELLAQIDRPDERNNVAQTIAGMWVQSDPDAALPWILERDTSERHAMLSMAAHSLAKRIWTARSCGYRASTLAGTPRFR